MNLKQHLRKMSEAEFLAAVQTFQQEFFRRWPAAEQLKEKIKESQDQAIIAAADAAVAEVKLIPGDAVQ